MTEPGSPDDSPEEDHHEGVPDWSLSTSLCMLAYSHQHHYHRPREFNDEGRDTIYLRMDEIDPGLVGCIDLLQLYRSVKSKPGCAIALRYLLPSDHEDRCTPTFVDQGEYERVSEQKGLPRVCKGALHVGEHMSRVMRHMKDSCKLFTAVSRHELAARIDRATRAVQKNNLSEDFQPCYAGVRTVPKPGKVVQDPDRQQLIYNINNKSPMELHRMIVDARQANAWMADDTSFPMFALDVLLQTMSNCSRRAQETYADFYILNADLRHYYFQYKIPIEWSALFQVKVRVADGDIRNIFLPEILPMGWAPACRIAQSATYALLLGQGVKKTAPPEYDGPKYIARDVLDSLTSKDSKTPPTWLPLSKDGRDVGGIFVILDNIFLVTTEKEVADFWEGRLKARRDYVNAIFKGDPGIETARMYRGMPESEQQVFLGIGFCYDYWRVVQKETPPRNTGLTPDGFEGSYRQLISLLGAALWGYRVRGVRLSTVRRFSELYRYAHPKEDPRKPASWDKGGAELKAVFNQDPDLLVALRKCVTDTEQRQRREVFEAWEYRSDMATQFWAVDASELRTAAIPVYLSNAQVKHEAWYGEKNHWCQQGISVAELAAIRLAVCTAVYLDRSTRLIIIATDSLCARGWVEKGAAPTVLAQGMIDVIYQVLEEAKARLVLTYVKSEENWADVPTRAPQHGVGVADALFDDKQGRGEDRRWATERLLKEASQQVCTLTRRSMGRTVKGPEAVRRERE